MKFVHKTVSIRTIDASLQDERLVEYLNEHGREGWRTVTIERRSRPYETVEINELGLYNATHTEHIVWIMLEREEQ